MSQTTKCQAIDCVAIPDMGRGGRWASRFGEDGVSLAGAGALNTELLRAAVAPPFIDPPPFPELDETDRFHGIRTSWLPNLRYFCSIAQTLK